MVCYPGWPILLLLVWDVLIVFAYNGRHWDRGGVEETFRWHCTAPQSGSLLASVTTRLPADLADLADAQGGTERIKNTPMPKQYDYLPMLLPIGLVEQLG